ncbi:protocatechuate 3,4-dioxygenase subunit beta [Micrococcales bacterium 31B]|nr:protocatechuate 3,4-dioxygenase subunit beta [Micrococcales bacterium 31B]
MSQPNSTTLASETGTTPVAPASLDLTPSPTLHLPKYLSGPEGTHPPLLSPGYKSTVIRAPMRTPFNLPQRLTEITGPVLGDRTPDLLDADLTKQHEAMPQGQRIIVYGRVTETDGRPVPNALIEVWQANAAGRYRHDVDRWDAPIDENFSGLGRVLTDADGNYEFTSIKPGAYPWRNHLNAWRPAHIHFSLFGRAFTQRLVTQMYFPDDPLFGQDPIFNSIPDQAARERLISRFDLDRTVPDWALAYRFDIVLRGTKSTPFEHEVDVDDDDDLEA